MGENKINDQGKPGIEVGDRQHLNPDGQTDAEKGMNLGGVGGAITGAVAGSLVGPLGLVAGAVIGGMAGALASGAAVAAIDKVDGDSATDHRRAARQDDELHHLHHWKDPRLDSYELPEQHFDTDAPVAPESRHDLDLVPLTPYYAYSRSEDYPIPAEEHTEHAKHVETVKH